MKFKCVFSEPHWNTSSQAENFDLHKFGHKGILKSLSSIAARIRIRCCLELIFLQPYKFEKKVLSKTQMEEDLMSAKEAVALSNGEIEKHEGAAKRQRVDRCFSSFMEISIEPGIKSLKHLDSKKFKSEIKRWAKAVVTYARQVSERFGSSRR